MALPTTEPALKTYVLSEADAVVSNSSGNKRVEFNLYTTEQDARYWFRIQACYGQVEANLCGPMEYTDAFLDSYLDSDPQVSGWINPYYLGSNQITGLAKFSSGATGRSIYLKDENGQILAQQAGDTTYNYFTFDNLDQIPQLSAANLPTEIIVEAYSSTTGIRKELGNFTLSRHDNPDLVAMDDTITVPKGKTTPLNLIGNDVIDGDPLAVEIIEHPIAGTITASGINVQYTPPNDYFTGTVSFKYQLKDHPVGQQNAGKTSNIATVQLTVEGDNGIPVGGADSATAHVNIATSSARADQPELSARASTTVNSTTTVTGNETVTIAVLANDSDDGGIENLTIIDGEISGTKGFIALSEDKRSILYTPAQNQYEGETFYYRATDGKGGVSSPTPVNVEVIAEVDPLPTPTIALNGDGTKTAVWLTNSELTKYKVERKLTTPSVGRCPQY